MVLAKRIELETPTNTCGIYWLVLIMHLVSYLPRFLEDPGGENLDFQTFLSLNKWVRKL